MRIIGAGFGRTGTHSLKVALERLLGGTCHHMMEVFAHPDEVPIWTAAARGDAPDWATFLSGYTAICDWPGAACWPELAAAFPDAPVVLSHRDVDSWWRSATATIFPGVTATDAGDPWRAMVDAILARSGITDVTDEAGCKAAYLANLERARAEIPAARLVEWTAADGWEPLCAALGVAVPDEPFPLTNTTAEFQARAAANP